MILAVNDNRTLSLALLDAPSGAFYNWKTRLMDAAFDYTKHLQSTTVSPIQLATPTPPAGGSPLPAPPATLFAYTKYVDVGDVLENWPNLVPAWFVVDANGVPQLVSDLWGNPAPNRIPTWGGFGR